ncbi:MAG: hypothetical protein L0J74_07755 [Corynebacterium sp.]|uniref:hypothetical protein n=1 Tax=Corynebacterium sp. TaxID=1720 RepID=UPI0026494C08|nr:hypothetical protein [Corynebacterium sp.]MDN5722128.1 hypothetical protein [Corynebacterium sp.]MDN6281917.1 hypothetical protein [Corynebacterium sp.]MDN6305687.1 hypothetical protein [Corynebacterium sp.]MDN6366937.1 hypothetical protein [Corynebacterium sp.]MDN6396521.1 hypothetical protein [Corynebacterium sp.]
MEYSSDRLAGSADKSDAAAATDAERIRQLERDNIRLREERDILRRAAKYFTEEACLASRLLGSLTTPAPTTPSRGSATT